MKQLKETIHSAMGFYIGDSKGIAPKRLKLEARVACSGGGKWKDDETGAEAVGVHVGSSALHGSYNATNGDRFDISGNTFALIPLELITATVNTIGNAGRVVFDGGDATLETIGETIKITLPSTEIVKIHTGRTE